MNDIVPENTSTPTDLLAIAVQQNADIDKLEKLMGLKERFDAAEAKKAFAEALAGFQSELEPITKNRKGHNSMYADIDDIAQAIRPILAKYGLSYQFKQSQEGSAIRVDCVVTHQNGHSETTTLISDADSSGGKNGIQSIASAVTYLRRYTLTGALGITTGNDDNDGGKPDITVDQLLEYNQCVSDNIHSVSEIKLGLATGDYSSACEAWRELDHETQIKLWRAPTKGGIFTTKERSQMQSSEFRQS